MAEKNMFDGAKGAEQKRSVAEILPVQDITDKNGNPVEGFFFRGFLVGNGIQKDRDGNDVPYAIVYGNGESPRIKGIDLTGVPRFTPVFLRVVVRSYNGNTYLSALGGDEG